MAQIVVFVFWWPWPWHWPWHMLSHAMAWCTAISKRRIRPIWMGDMPRLQFWKTPYANGKFGCHGFTWYVILIGAVCDMIHSMGPIKVCTDIGINRYKMYEVRKYVFDITWRKHGTSYVMCITTLLLGILIRNILKPTISLYDFRFK